MADPVRLKSLDGIPEPLHPHFAKVGEGEGEEYEYRPPGVQLDKETAGLRSALEKVKRKASAADDLERQLRDYRERWTFDGQELDPDDVKAIYEQRRSQQGAEMITRADAEKLAEDRRQKALVAAKKDADRQLSEYQHKLAEKDAELHDVVVKQGILSVAQNEDLPFRLQPKAAELLIAMAEREKCFRVIDGVAVPVNGDEPLTNNKGERMSLVEWMIDRVQNFPLLMKPSEGVGSTPSPSGSVGNGGFMRRGLMSDLQRSEYIEKHGSQKYLELPQ